MALAPGTRLGPYEIAAQIGVGGMGEVYRATDTKLKREVAVKVLPAALAADPERLARFQREAEVLASLNHPNIAAIYGLEEADSTKALVMELVEGPTLEDRIAQGAIPVDEALPIAKQIAEALEAAHEQGIIHRDLKPANVKLRPDGVVKVLDFGLAKALEPSSAMSQAPTITTPAMTQAGMILGTAAYMSPEQARGKAVDKRTDIWAFGCVLYEMLTSKRVFEDEDVSMTLSKVLQREPDFDVLPGVVPTHVRQTLRLCLRKPLKERVPDIGAVRLALEGAFETGASHAAASVGVAQPVWRRAMPLALTAVVGVIIGITAWNLKPTLQPSLPVSRTVVALQADETILSTAVPLALSPDGSLLVYAAQKGNDPVRLYLRPMNSLEDQLLSGTDGASNPFFSPDGQWVGFFAARQLKKVPITGGAVLTISSTSDRAQGASWGADDRIIFSAVGSPGLMQVSSDGGTPETLTSPDVGSQDSFHWWPEILPGGQAVLFTTISGVEGDSTIVAQRLDTGERKVLVQGGSFPHYVSTGHLVYNQSETLMAVPFDLDRLEISGPPVPVIEGIRSPMMLRRDNAHFAISRTGTLAYIAGIAEESASTLVWVDRQGVAEPLSAPPRNYGFPQVSPDGQRVAAGITEGETHIWVYDILRTTLTRQTFGGGVNTTPVWSPDGRRLAFLSNREGPLNMFWQLADGGGGVERLTTVDNQTAPASFSPDGQLLAFVEDSPAGRAIRVLNLADHEAETFLQTGYEETAPKFSRDGNWMVYTSTESGRREVYVQPYPGPGGKWQISSDGGQEPVWNPQGGELFYRSGNRIMAVAVDTDSGFTAGTPQMLFEGPYLPTAASLPYYGVSPNGQRFLMLEPVVSQTGATQIIVVQNWHEELKRLVPVD